MNQREKIAEFEKNQKQTKIQMFEDSMLDSQKHKIKVKQHNQHYSNMVKKTIPKRTRLYQKNKEQEESAEYKNVKLNQSVTLPKIYNYASPRAFKQLQQESRDLVQLELPNDTHDSRSQSSQSI